MLNFLNWSINKMNPPKNRNEEFAVYVIKHNSEWLDYRLFAKMYYDLNAHKKLALMEKNGFDFEKRDKKFVSEYGFTSEYLQFRLKTPKEDAIEMYNKLTTKK